MGGTEGNLTPSMSLLIDKWPKTNGKTQQKSAVTLLIRTDRSVTVNGTVRTSQCLKVMTGTRLPYFPEYK